jgi:hypothetical protein
VALSDDLRRAAESAVRWAEMGEELTGIIPAEPSAAVRVYLCSFTLNGGRRWLVFDDRGSPVTSRSLVREAVSIAALCELAEETAVGGDLDDLAAELVALELTERPVGIEQAQEAVRALQHAVGAPPQVASPERLDGLGHAARRLEQTLGDGASPFAEAMKVSTASVEALTQEVESNYKVDLE